MREMQPPPPLCVADGIDGEYVRYLKNIDFNKITGYRKELYESHFWKHDGKQYWQKCETDEEGRIICVVLYGSSSALDEDVPTTPIDRLAPLKHVREAYLTESFKDRPPHPLTDDGFQHLGGWTGLARLKVTTTTLSGKAFGSLAEHNPLEHLKVIEVYVTHGADAVFAALKTSKDLRKICLMNTDLSDEGLAHISYLTRVEELEIGCNKMTGKGMIHLSGLKNLKSLSLDDMPIGNEGLKHLSKVSSLKELYLVDTSITDAGLAYLPNLEYLESLSLDDATITPVGCTHLVELKRLTYLSLDGTSLSDSAVPLLSQMSNLRSLSLLKTHISHPSVQALQTALPDCNISWSMVNE